MQNMCHATNMMLWRKALGIINELLNETVVVAGVIANNGHEFGANALRDDVAKSIVDSLPRVATCERCKINQESARHPVLINKVTNKPKERHLCGRGPQIESNRYFAVEHGQLLVNRFAIYIIQLHCASLQGSATAELRSGLE